MADQITSFVSLTLLTTNNTLRSFTPPQLRITQNAEGAFETTIGLTTTDVAIPITTNLTTYGVGYIQNVSASTAVVVVVGADSAGAIIPFTRLKWREGWPVRLRSGTTYRAETESSSGKLLFGCWED